MNDSSMPKNSVNTAKYPVQQAVQTPEPVASSTMFANSSTHNTASISRGMAALTPPMQLPRFFTPRDYSDYLFFLALVTLPIDGTVLGFFQPFWTPISPWLLVAYCAANPRLLRLAAHRYAPFMLLPVVLVLLSMPSWVVFGLHNNAVVMSLTGVIAVPATLAALDIAFVHKQLNWQESVRIVLATYWFAFAVGVVQWLAIRLQLGSVQGFFTHLMYRSYMNARWGGVGGRPQFLFAEPSYIGMHLFGILLPLFWFMCIRDRIFAQRLKHLIAVFAAGSVLMGSGTRIVLDSLVALIAVIVIETHWHNQQQRRRGITQFICFGVIAIASFMINSRLDSIMHNGMEGDGSFFMRIWQPLAPLCGMIIHPWTLLTGFGAGNIASATHEGANMAAHVLSMMHTDATNATHWYDSITPDTVWTMCSYVNFITEFGIIGFVAFLIITLRFISRFHTWNKLTMCWLILLAYLYIQFEGYAFAAIPLMVWALTRQILWRPSPGHCS
ncbi:hypothetical protein BISA_2136 [Bifidobacterium saguini DSM 23967]|uniref:Uncharacterized protein n=2 Tax=Bifidobacterium saguini TaxID=762210 RepID=A0A087D922_9BIFI|nr:hypothetical protein [Bifidobacterium saguini]KFI92022.1 hypothetical protein BISA_2136 [Bifidobacterium saguini DSM 23967]QTB90257.1 hypothetical protein BSD967_07885 [Bifidobacterium saguini]